MAEAFQTQLQELGLLPAEAQVYLALVRNGALAGSAVASLTGSPRSSVYLTLNSLLDKGLIEGGPGNGSRFSVAPPDKALPCLVASERQSLAARENLASQLGRQLALLAIPNDNGRDGVIQVVRNPQVTAERYDRLQLEAQRQVDVITKAPILNPHRDNPAQEKAQQRGVRFRSIYERAALQDDAIKPYLAQWVAAGEEARVYNGELPHKLAIFDSQVVVLPLDVPGDQMRTLFIKNAQLAMSLSVMFDFFWQRSQPITASGLKRTDSRDLPTKSDKRGRAKREKIKLQRHKDAPGHRRPERNF